MRVARRKSRQPSPTQSTPAPARTLRPGMTSLAGPGSLAAVPGRGSPGSFACMECVVLR